MSEAARRIFAPSSLVTSRVLVADASPCSLGEADADNSTALRSGTERGVKPSR